MQESNVAEETKHEEKPKAKDKDELRAKIQAHRLWPALEMLVDDSALAPVAKRARILKDVEEKSIRETNAEGKGIEEKERVIEEKARVRAYQTRAVSMGTYCKVFEPAADAHSSKRVQLLTSTHVQARYARYTGFHEQLRQQQCQFEEQLHTMSVDADASPFAAQLQWTQRDVAEQVEAEFTLCRQNINATFNRTGAVLGPRRPCRALEQSSKDKNKKSKKRRQDKAESSGEPKRKRGTLPPDAVAAFRKWMAENFTDPYPTEQEKRDLAKRFGLTPEQVNYWFINSRVRYWRPLVEAAKRSQAKTSVKKRKREDND